VVTRRRRPRRFFDLFRDAEVAQAQAENAALQAENARKIDELAARLAELRLARIGRR
jgi:hypothetical protein